MTRVSANGSRRSSTAASALSVPHSAAPSSVSPRRASCAVHATARWGTRRDLPLPARALAHPRRTDPHRALHLGAAPPPEVRTALREPLAGEGGDGARP